MLFKVLLLNLMKASKAMRLMRISADMEDMLFSWAVLDMHLHAVPHAHT